MSAFDLNRAAVTDPEECSEGVDYGFGWSRRSFVQGLGVGLLIAVAVNPVVGQSRRGGGGGGPRPVGARVHIGQDGSITVMTGKVEMGQGGRAELTQAAAEELRVAVDRIELIMADTSVVPNDGISAGSRTTPGTVPVVREGAAAARQVLVGIAAKKWGVDAGSVTVGEGEVRHGSTDRRMSYGELAQDEEAIKAFGQNAPSGVELTPAKEWKVLGKSVERPNGRELVMGTHRFPSDVQRSGMLYGKVLRAPSYGARLVSVEESVGRSFPGVRVVRDGDFVGVAAPTSFLAEKAIGAIGETAKWEAGAQHPGSEELFTYLKAGVAGGEVTNPFTRQVGEASKVHRGGYHVGYVQHAPLEPRAAVAEWAEGRLTVWTGTQNPFGYHGELARVFHLGNDRVRVVVPDFGAGFGGKHTGEVAVEAARLAQGAGRPVSLRWTREEEFTWAYFRPAAVIEVEATLDASGKLTSWHFVNINSGGAAIDTPYAIADARSRFVQSRAPLRQGSYRALASTANNFARESAMDELALLAGSDPLQFRLAHLKNARLRAVLENAAARFDWGKRLKSGGSGVGLGLACGTEKGSYVAACVEVALDSSQKRFAVRRVYQAFECGAILNPDNLLSQVQGSIIMGLGAALREEIRFAKGQILNGSFGRYKPPRFEDVPELEIHLMDRPDLPAVGGGETPIIAIAPAIANAIAQGGGPRIRQMPIRWPVA